MNKPNDIRAMLQGAVPHLAQNPDALHIFADSGHIVATAVGGNLSFEYQYNLIVLVTDYSDHADTLMVPLLAWAAEHQPELLANPDKRENALRFRAELLNHNSADIEITLPLTERVKVTLTDAGYTVEHLPEPTDPNKDINWSLSIMGLNNGS